MRQGSWAAAAVVIITAFAIFAAGGFGLGNPSVQAGVLAAQGLVQDGADLQRLGLLWHGAFIAALLLGGVMGDVLGVWLIVEGLVLASAALLAFAFGAEPEIMIAAIAASAAGSGLAIVGSVPILVRAIEARARPVAHIVVAGGLGLGVLALHQAAPLLGGPALLGAVDLDTLDMWAGIGALAAALLALLTLGGAGARQWHGLVERDGTVEPVRLFAAALFAGCAAEALQVGALELALLTRSPSAVEIAALFVIPAAASVLAPLVIVPVAAWSGPRAGFVLLLPVFALVALAAPHVAGGALAVDTGLTVRGVFMTASYGLLAAIATTAVRTARPALVAGSALAGFEIGRAAGPLLLSGVARLVDLPVERAAATALACAIVASLVMASRPKRRAGAFA